MKFRMAENSLFAIMLRKPWWVSALTAVALVAFARFMLPPAWFLYGAPIALPFVVIAAITGWRQMQAPSEGRIAAVETAVRAMAAGEFTRALEDAWRRDGWTVARIDDPGADLQITQGWRRGVVACRRWKVARTGVEPLRELQAARERLEVHDAIYVTVGDVTEQAREFARQQRIRIANGPDLARMLPGAGRESRGSVPKRSSD